MTRTLRRFTPEEDEIIRTDYLDYIGVRAIAIKLGRDDGTIRQRIVVLGLKRDSKVTKILKWCPEHLESILKEKGAAAFIEAVNLHSQQLEEAEASNAAALSAAETAKIAAQIAEIDARPELERKEKMMAMRAMGITLTKIGEHFGLTRERVRQLTNLEKLRSRSVQNILTINANLDKRETKLFDKKRYVRTKMLEMLIQLWNSAADDVREEFLKTINHRREAAS